MTLLLYLGQRPLFCANGVPLSRRARPGELRVECCPQALGWMVAWIHEDSKVDSSADLGAQRGGRGQRVVEPDGGVDRFLVENAVQKAAVGLCPQRDVCLL